jgi:hypothetical protein
MIKKNACVYLIYLSITLVIESKKEIVHKKKKTIKSKKHLGKC